MDAGDIALPYRFERQLAFVRENPDVKATSCLAYYINATSRRVGKTFHDLTFRQAFRRYIAEGRAIGLLHRGALIERETLQRLGGYRAAFGPANDINLWWRVSDDGLVLVQSEYPMENRVHCASGIAQSFNLSRCVSAGRKSRSHLGGVPCRAPQCAMVAALEPLAASDRKRIYRQSALDRISFRSGRAVLKMGAAVFLQPTYAVRRVLGRRYRDAT
jgi:hypothetical protein